MQKGIRTFILNCQACAHCNNENVASSSLLQPLLIPPGVWCSVAMDFVEGLPKSSGKDMIWVVVYQISKYAHFIALSHPIIAMAMAQVFMDQIYKLHGAPTNIVSDRDLMFISTFWKEFLGQLGIKQTYHLHTTHRAIAKAKP